LRRFHLNTGRRAEIVSVRHIRPITAHVCDINVTSGAIRELVDPDCVSVATHFISLN